MQKNNNAMNILKLAPLALLLAAVLVFSSACGELSEMLSVLEGGDNSRADINSSRDWSEENDDTSTEAPDTAAELFVTSAYGEDLMITGYTGNASFVKIPAQIDGKTVVAISADAIKDQTPDGGEALYITDIIVPDTVNQMAFSAFSGCKKLATLTVPFVGGKADDHSYIGYVFGARSASGNNSALPETLTTVKAGGVSVADEAFKGCENIENITLKDVTFIGNNAFKGCTALNTLIIPETVTTIGSNVFDGCDSLAEIALPFLGNDSDKLFFGAVFGAESYKQNYDYIPASLRRVTLSCPSDIPEGAFYECNGLTSLTLNGAVNSVGKNAFYRCKKLKNLVINANEAYSGISSLSAYSFAYCAALGEVKLDGGITNIPDGAFYGCSALRTVRFGEATNAMPSTVSAVGKGAFAYCESLTAMELSASLTVIEEQTFYGCSYLLSAKIPSSVTEIKKDAFKGCNNLKTLAIEKGLTTIGNGAFSYCSSLASVALPANVAVFGDYAFAYCKYLADVSIKCNDASLGKGVFTGCEKIVVTVDPESNTYASLIESGLGNTNLKAPE